jgi:hypothetical protein
MALPRTLGCVLPTPALPWSRPQPQATGALWAWLLVLLTGTVIRLLLPLRGFNFDFESYTIVADLVSRGENVYAGTTRYNYGPSWFWLLGLGQWLVSFAPDPILALRYFVVGLLTAVDIGICLILYRRFGLGAATLFYLNPISIIITGYHNQFDNLAILLGLGAVLVIGDEMRHPTFTRRKWLGLLLLGLSLMTKHLLFFFPVWLAVKQPGRWRKVLVMFVPSLTFALGFLPYLAAGRHGILHNVFMYGSFDNKIFHSLFVPGALQPYLHSDLLWVALLGLFALLARRQDPLRSLLLYLAVLVAAAPATNNQYLAIPLVYVATRMNTPLALYTLVGSYYLLIHKNGLQLTALDVRPVENVFYYSVCIFLLTLGIIWAQWQAPLRAGVKWLGQEVWLQLGMAGEAMPGSESPLAYAPTPSARTLSVDGN